MIYTSRLLDLLILIKLICIVSSSKDVGLGLLTQDGVRIESSGSDCEAGLYFEEELQLTCACVTGIWAFYNSWCASPVALVAGLNYCFQIESKIKQVSLLSSPDSIYFPSLTRLTSNMEQLKDIAFDDTQVNWNSEKSSFISVGAREWELMTPNGETYCLKHTLNATSYCHFTDIGDFEIKSVKIGCTMELNIILPDACIPFVLDEFKQGKHSCHESSPSHQLGSHPRWFPEDLKPLRNIVKRDIPVPDQDDYGLDGGNEFEPYSPPVRPVFRKSDWSLQQPGSPDSLIDGSINDKEGGEDFLDPVQALVKSNPLVMDELAVHVENEISQILGNSLPRTTVRRYPVLQILESSMEVMKKTCEVVSPSYLETALNTFIKVQLDSLHVREPYIVHHSFLRIQKALNACLAGAKPHNFKQPTNVEDVVCDDDRPKLSASETLLGELGSHTLTVPADRSAAGFEPIIETVWKIVINAHSYCYKYFSDYYNDHHSYTVALMPLFTNEIQSIWMPAANNGKYEEPSGEGAVLYGGIIGDHVTLMKSIDFCVAASRVNSDYPWFMNRPPKDTSNKWRRRKRRSLPIDSGYHCLKSPQELTTKFGLQECTN